MTLTQPTSKSVLSADKLLAHWQGHRQLTRKTIEAFPEDKLFSYSLGGMRPFAELVSEFQGMAVPGVSGIATGKWAAWADASPVTSKQEMLECDNPIIQLVGFRLDNEDYAIAITKIQEIILMKPITRIPQVPDFIEGLINLRGSVIPIVNLRKRFGLPARQVDDDTRTIVVNIHDKTVGCTVDAVTQVMRINRDQIQPPPL